MPITPDLAVWAPISCDYDPNTNEYILVETAADPRLPANDPYALGPTRTALYNADTLDFVSASWVYLGVTYDDEQASLDAWEPQEVPNPDPPPDDPPPDDPPPDPPPGG